MKSSLIILSRLLDSSLQRPFGAQTTFYRNLFQLGKKVNLDVIVVPPDGIRLGENLVDGFIPGGEGETWKKCKQPLSKVIYDRGFFTGLPPQEYEKIQKLRRELQQSGSVFVNPLTLVELTLDKLLFAQKMEKFGIAHPFTEIYEQRNVEKIFANPQFKIIKPRFGSRGEGVIHLVPKGSGGYILRFKEKDERGWWWWREIEITSYDNWLKEFSRLQERLEICHRSLLLQDGIVCQNCEYQEFDFRFLRQRTASAVEYSPVLARIDGNLSRGGGIKSMSDLFPQQTRETLTNWQEEMVALGEDVARRLELELAEEIGELAFDILLQKNGKPVLLELNSKPARSIFRKFAEQLPEGAQRKEVEQARVATLDRIIQRAIFLHSQNSVVKYKNV